MNDLSNEPPEHYTLPVHKSHFESIFTNTNDAMVFFDTESKIVRINTRFTEMFGYELSEVAGQHVNRVVDPFQREERYGDQRILARETVELEVVRYAKSGRAIQVLLKGGPVIVDGVVTGGYAIYSDITERKKAEEELLRAKAAAEEASRAKGEFLANMSHEIRTPLNGVVSMLSLLEETPINSAQREYIEMATASAETLLAVINDVLDFSRIEAGKMQLSVAPSDLEKEMNLVMSILASRAREKQVEFLTHYDVAAPQSVIADSMRLRQVLFNLAGNAVKFTEKGHILLDIRQVSRISGHARLRFSITDTGIGIPADKLEAVFQHFTQADYSSTRKFGGTGLGLSISRRLVAMMGGEIQVHSMVGEGSTFFFELDLPVRAGAFPEAPVSFDRAHALVVDDNKINRTILTEYLRSWNISAVTVSSGAEAVATLSERRTTNEWLDFALIDDQMPEMDGATLASLIREDGYWKRLPLIALSSRLSRESHQRLVTSGFSCFVPKPIIRADLLTQIENCMTGSVGSPFQQTRTKPARESSSVPGVVAVRQRQPTEAAQPSQATEPAPATARKPRILLAEDNDINRRSVQLMLEGIAQRVGIATDGETAVRMYAEDEFDMILMDVQMPVIDGLEACRRIRQLEAERRPGAHVRPVPIIAFTANAMAKDRDECLAAGMNDYLSKPLRKGPLLEMISRYVGMGEPMPEPVPERRPALLGEGELGAAPAAAAAAGASTQAANPELVVFEAQEFMLRYDNNLELAAEIMREALQSVPEETATLALHLSAENAVGCHAVAHKMKGTLAYIGAMRLHRCCQDIIQAADAAAWHEAEDSLTRLRQELETFRPEVEAFFLDLGIQV